MTSFTIASDQIADVLACRPVAVVDDLFINETLQFVGNDTFIVVMDYTVTALANLVISVGPDSAYPQLVAAIAAHSGAALLPHSEASLLCVTSGPGDNLVPFGLGDGVSDHDGFGVGDAFGFVGLRRCRRSGTACRFRSGWPCRAPVRSTASRGTTSRSSTIPGSDWKRRGPGLRAQVARSGMCGRCVQSRSIYAGSFRVGSGGSLRPSCGNRFVRRCCRGGFASSALRRGRHVRRCRRTR